MNLPVPASLGLRETVLHGDEGEVRIPPWVRDLASFRRWAASDDLPKKTRLHYFQGKVAVDVSKEQLFSHNQVKAEFTAVLRSLVKAQQLGYYFTDGVRLSNIPAELSTNPDGVFASFETLRSGQLRLIEGAREGYVEVEGTPDLVLEIVSPSWVDKDTEVLRALYAAAGITEYWLVDVRGTRHHFQILRLTATGYAATRARGGWLKSSVLNRSFQLVRQTDPLGHPSFTLELKS